MSITRVRGALDRGPVAAKSSMTPSKGYGRGGRGFAEMGLIFHTWNKFTSGERHLAWGLFDVTYETSSSQISTRPANRSAGLFEAACDLKLTNPTEAPDGRLNAQETDRSERFRHYKLASTRFATCGFQSPLCRSRYSGCARAKPAPAPSRSAHLPNTTNDGRVRDSLPSALHLSCASGGAKPCPALVSGRINPTAAPLASKQGRSGH
jgi:hypothetical protein